MAAARPAAQGRPIDTPWRNIGFGSKASSIVSRIARNGQQSHGGIFGPFASQKRVSRQSRLEAGMAQAEPEALYPAGDGAFEFERTVSRL